MKEKESNIELGDKVKDIITGFEGIVTGYTTWLTGCDSAVVHAKSDGKTEAPSMSLDVNKLEIIEKGAVKLPTQNTRVETKEERAKKPGGPHKLREQVG